MSNRRIVQNITPRYITIHDLPRIPTIPPGEQSNLLDYHGHADLEHSKDLASLLEMGWLEDITSDS